MKFRNLFSAVALFLFASFALAQTTAPTSGLSFGTTANAVGINLGGSWRAAAVTDEALSVVNSKTLGQFYLESSQVIPTDGSFSGYYAGLKWTPRIDSLISKTTLPANMFQVSIHGTPGFSRNAAGVNRFGGLAGVSLDYDPQANGHFAVNLFRVDYLNAPGFGKTPNGVMLSSGIAVYFGGTK